MRQDQLEHQYSLENVTQKNKNIEGREVEPSSTEGIMSGISLTGTTSAT